MKMMAKEKVDAPIVLTREAMESRSLNRQMRRKIKSVENQQNINSTQNLSGDEGRSPTLYELKTRQFLIDFPALDPLECHCNNGDGIDCSYDYECKQQRHVWRYKH